MQTEESACARKEDIAITMDQHTDAELADIAIVCFEDEKFNCADCKIRKPAYMVAACEIGCRYDIGLEIAKRLQAACAREGAR